jgi:hypothetical protein
MDMNATNMTIITSIIHLFGLEHIDSLIQIIKLIEYILE